MEENSVNQLEEVCVLVSELPRHDQLDMIVTQFFVARLGGKHFSRNLQPLDKDGNPLGMWRVCENVFPPLLQTSIIIINIIIFIETA